MNFFKSLFSPRHTTRTAGSLLSARYGCTFSGFLVECRGNDHGNPRLTTVLPCGSCYGLPWYAPGFHNKAHGFPLSTTLPRQLPRLCPWHLPLLSIHGNCRGTRHGNPRKYHGNCHGMCFYDPPHGNCCGNPRQPMAIAKAVHTEIPTPIDTRIHGNCHGITTEIATVIHGISHGKWIAVRFYKIRYAVIRTTD